MKRFFMLAAAAVLVFSSFIGKGAPQNKVAYITIDDGPTLNTPYIIDCLKRRGAGATFFVLKERIELYPDYIKKMENEGFGIGLHGVSHSMDIYSSPTRPLSEMNETNDALYRLIGRRSALARTPYGSRANLSERQLKLLNTAGYRMVDWNVDPRDSVGAIIDKTAVLKNLKTGLDEVGSPAVILLHDRKSTAAALEEILELLEAEGYELRTLTENSAL